MSEPKLKMTVDEALKFADEWTNGATFHADSKGWKAVCAVLAEEVRKLRDKKAFYFLNPREHRAMKNALNRSVTFIDEKMESKKSEVDEEKEYELFRGWHLRDGTDVSVRETPYNYAWQVWLARAKNDAGK